MGVDERDVPDALQKVFMIAYRRLADFEGRSSMKTWLCGIALRVASDHRRSAVVRREVLRDEPELELRHDSGENCDTYRQEQLAELDAVLAELSVEQRTVLVLFELEEMSGEEIAKLVGCPEGTVRSRLRLARQSFTRIVEARQSARLRRVAGGTA
jgi:RNA polymerase sigma-70 factor (ECF subfamily)